MEVWIIERVCISTEDIIRINIQQKKKKNIIDRYIVVIIVCQMNHGTFYVMLSTIKVKGVDWNKFIRLEYNKDGWN